jgi:cytochrome bd-type quinol oxidase subunit 2
MIFILAAAGVTMIVTQGEIFRPLREGIKMKSAFFGKLIECPMCFGVYAGWLVQGLILWSTGQPVKAYHILYGFINSFCSYCLIVIINTVEEHCIYITEKRKIEIGQERLKDAA